MRIRASAIIKYNGKIILIKREKGHDDNKNIYYVVPGGGVEDGEDIKTATYREIEEEVGITINLTTDCFHLETAEKNEYFWVADYESGIVGSGTGPEFTNSNYQKYGSYELVLVAKDEIGNLNLMPPEAKEYIIKNVDKIFGK